MARSQVTNQITVTIDTLGARGDGIGQHDGKPVYVAGALPGESILVDVTEVKRSGTVGRINEVLEPSPDRREAPCKHFDRCGSCQLQHLGEGLYANWTQSRAAFALKQQGITDVPFENAFIVPPASRRRLALKALKTSTKLVLGFNKVSSHQIEDIDHCLVADVQLTDVFEPLRNLLWQALPSSMLSTIHLTRTDSGIDLVVDTSVALDLSTRELCTEFANAHDIASFHWNHSGFLDPVAIRREAVMKFAGARLPVPPAAFLQATSESQKAMVETVLSACGETKRAADLFCGIGTFTFPLAQRFQVLAVEGAKDALASVEAGRNTAAAAGVNLKQIVTKHRDLFRRPLSEKELAGFDVVVMDPPRAGAEAQARELAKSGVKKVVSVSCNPNTFARDARILIDGGYELKMVKPIDQFLWSTHLELIGIFQRP